MTIRHASFLLFLLVFRVTCGQTSLAAMTPKVLPDDAAATAAEVRGSATAGFGGYYRIGRCMPIKVRLENTGKDLAGEISVRAGKDLFTQPILLPAPSRKVFSLYVVPPKDLRNLDVEVYASGRTITLLHVSVQRLADEETLHLISTSLESAYPAPRESADAQSIERRAFLDPGDFPENWSDYETVDAITIDAADTVRLNEAQRTALSRWVLLGGNVNLVSEDGTGTARWTNSGALSNRDAKNIAVTSQQSTTRGLGIFRTIRDLTQLSGPTPGAASGTEHISVPLLDQEIFEKLRVTNPVSHAYLGWYTAAFLLFYGAAVVLWLWPRRGSVPAGKWKLLPVSVIAFLFAFLSPVLGSIANGGAIFARQVSLIHVFPNIADAFSTNQSLVLSPRRGTFHLIPAVPSAYLVQRESGDPGRNSVYEFRIKNAPAARIEMNLWDTQTLNIESFSDQGLILALQRTDELILSNRSGFALKGCTLVRRGASSRLGDILPKHEIRLVRQSIGGSDPADAGFIPGILYRVVAAYQNEIDIGTIGDCIVCGLDGLVPGLTSQDDRLTWDGATAVIFHLGPQWDDKGDSNQK